MRFFYFIIISIFILNPLFAHKIYFTDSSRALYYLEDEQRSERPLKFFQHQATVTVELIEVDGDKKTVFRTRIDSFPWEGDLPLDQINAFIEKTVNHWMAINAETLACPKPLEKGILTTTIKAADKKLIKVTVVPKIYFSKFSSIQYHNGSLYGVASPTENAHPDGPTYIVRKPCDDLCVKDTWFFPSPLKCFQMSPMIVYESGSWYRFTKDGGLLEFDLSKNQAHSLVFLNYAYFIAQYNGVFRKKGDGFDTFALMEGLTTPKDTEAQLCVSGDRLLVYGGNVIHVYKKGLENTFRFNLQPSETIAFAIFNPEDAFYYFAVNTTEKGAIYRYSKDNRCNEMISLTSENLVFEHDAPITSIAIKPDHMVIVSEPAPQASSQKSSVKSENPHSAPPPNSSHSARRDNPKGALPEIIFEKPKSSS